MVDTDRVSSENESALVYDWQCPACDLYCHQLTIRESRGRFRLINARDNPEVMKDNHRPGLRYRSGHDSEVKRPVLLWRRGDSPVGSYFHPVDGVQSVEYLDIPFPRPGETALSGFASLP